MPRAFEKDGVWIKTCPHCKETKTLDKFADNCTTTDKKEYWCRQCRAFPPNNRRRKYECGGKWVKECAACERTKDIDDFGPGKRTFDKLNSYCRPCAVEKAIEGRYRTGIDKYRVIDAPRTNVRRVLVQGGTKSARTQELIGCTWQEFRQHIESLWLPGMTWENYGKTDQSWSFDHIFPCQLFDLMQPNHQRACFSHLNTRPCWHKENIAKNDYLDDGRRARNLTPDEKRTYLISKDFGHLFTDPAP